MQNRIRNGLYGIGLSLVLVVPSLVLADPCEFLIAAQTSDNSQAAAETESESEDSKNSQPSAPSSSCEESKNEIIPDGCLEDLAKVLGKITKEDVSKKLKNVWKKTERAHVEMTKQNKLETKARAKAKVSSFLLDAKALMRSTSLNDLGRARVYRSIEFLSKTLQNYYRGTSVTAEKEDSSKRPQVKKALSELLKVAANDSRLASCLKQKGSPDELISELPLETKPKPEDIVLREIKNDVLGPRGSGVIIRGLNGPGVMEKASDLTQRSSPEQVIEALAHRMPIKNTSEPNLTVLDQRLSQVIRFPEKQFKDNAEHLAETKRRLALYYLYLGNQNTFNIYSAKHSSGTNTVGFTPSITINLEAEEGQPVVTGHGVMSLKSLNLKNPRDPHSTVKYPPAILHFEENCLTKDCSKGTYHLQSFIKEYSTPDEKALETILQKAKEPLSK